MTNSLSLPEAVSSSIPSRSTRTTATEPHMKQPTTLKARNPLALAASLGLCALLAGCATAGSGNTTNSVNPLTPAVIHATGSVHGGQNPIFGATIQLYTVGTSGTASASTPLIASTVTTSDGTGLTNANANAGNANNTLPLGFFTITGDYTCTGTTPGTEVYLVASGGNPGSGTNTNAVLVVALGSCANLLANAASISVNIDEVTTVAAAYSLAPFATDIAHIGSGASTAGLINAFNNVNSIANYQSGTTVGASLPTGAVAPVAEIDTLADILASCVNTTGASSANCTALFSATGASDTFGAALAIAKNPGTAAITNLFTIAGGTGAPFQPTLPTQPGDFTLALNYNAGGTLATPYALAADASGNIWVANETGTTITELSPSGAVLAAPTATGLTGAQGIAVDTLGNVWVANTAGNSVIKFTLTSGSVSATNSFTGNGISAPTAIAFDSANNAFVANFNGNSVTELNNSGVNQNSSPFTGNANNITMPTGIAIGHGGGAIYVTSGLGYVVKLSNVGVFKNTVTDNALQGPTSLAINSSGQILVAGFTTGSAISGALGEFTDSGSILTVSPVSPVTTGLATPLGIATDGTSFFVANSTTGGGLSQFTYGSATPTSPTAGYGSLNTPVGVAVDPAGCVWTANSGDNTVSQYIGLALSATTPLAATAGP